MVVYTDRDCGRPADGTSPARPRLIVPRFTASGDLISVLFRGTSAVGQPGAAAFIPLGSPRRCRVRIAFPREPVPSRRRGAARAHPGRPRLRGRRGEEAVGGGRAAQLPRRMPASSSRPRAPRRTHRCSTCPPTSGCGCRTAAAAGFVVEGSDEKAKRRGRRHPRRPADLRRRRSRSAPGREAKRDRRLRPRPSARPAGRSRSVHPGRLGWRPGILAELSRSPRAAFGASSRALLLNITWTCSASSASVFARPAISASSSAASSRSRSAPRRVRPSHSPRCCARGSACKRATRW